MLSYKEVLRVIIIRAVSIAIIDNAVLNIIFNRAALSIIFTNNILEKIKHTTSRRSNKTAFSA